MLPKSELKYEDMTDILEHYQSHYVPSVDCATSIPGTDGEQNHRHFRPVLIGGNYLTVSRARGSQMIRSTSELELFTLDGLLPVAEDWHAKVYFLEVT